jgi:hypothetical protein
MVRSTLLAMGVLCLSPAAYAQQCPDYTKVAERLQALGEAPKAMALTAAGTTLVFFVHPETDAWTVLEISADGKCSRIPASGDAWRDIAPKPKGKGT